MAISECNTRIDEKGKELLQHGTVLFPAACYYDDLTENPVPWHWHEELEAVIVTEGSAVFAADHERVELKKGEGCVINANILHAAWNAGDQVCRLHSIVFHPKLVGGASESIFWQKYLLPILENRVFYMLALKLIPKDIVLLDYIEHAWQSIANESPGYEFMARDSLSRLLFMMQEYIPHQEKDISQKVRRNEERIKRMLDYIRKHLADEISIQEIAHAASVSSSECIRCFKQTIGTTPIQYVRQMRLQKATELLMSSNKKIIEIGIECGFQEMSYFSRIFKEQYGATPSKYRVQNK
ncbi:MAG: AraC family transcriptional regulator [Clostridiales bacterium]|nr:AraC family transcriptional regulator [Clostridiales bacterium]